MDATISILPRAISCLLLLGVFLLLTSLAHRSDPRALGRKIIGLSICALLPALIWFYHSPSAQHLSRHVIGGFAIVLVVLAYLFAALAMKNKLAVRWIVPGLVLIGLIVSLIVDLCLGTAYSDWTLALTIEMFVATFFGHLLRARRTQAMLSVNHRVHQQAILEQNREQEIRADERLRITQDLHDGLGSQLVSSLALAENGQCSQTELKDILQSCLDDLRLTLEANGVAREDFTVALANLRYRYEPRLRAAGVTISQWDVKSLPLDLHIPTRDITPLLRIVQEAICNVIKHSHAKNISFTFTKEHDTLEILIKDDGIGLDPTKPAKGMGLSGMQKRAYALGADLVVVNRKEIGTSICVRYRLSLIATQH